MIAGTPIGVDACVAGEVAARACDVASQADRLEALPLVAQSRWCLFRLSLAHRMVHLCRAVPWELPASSTRRIKPWTAGTACAVRLGFTRQACSALGDRHFVRPRTRAKAGCMSKHISRYKAVAGARSRTDMIGARQNRHQDICKACACACLSNE